MTYGLMIENPNGQLCISDRRIVPHCVGKPAFQSALYQGTNYLGRHKYQLTYSTPWAPSQPIVYGMVLPVESWNTRYGAPSHLAQASTTVINVLADAQGQYVPPTLYAFTLGFPTASGESYGLQLFDQQGRLTFDSGRKHLFFHQIDTVNGGGAITNPAGLTKPGFIPFDYASLEVIGDYDEFDQQTETSTVYYSATLYRRYSNGTMYAYTENVSTYSLDMWMNSTTIYGRNTSQAMPWFDATLYD